MLISPADHARIAEAISAAEDTTSGEIFAIVETRRPRYPQVALAGAILVALALPMLLLFAGLDPARLPFGDGWTAGPPEPRRIVETLSALQALTFVVVLALLLWTPLGAWATPRAIRRDRVHAEAMAQFLAKGLHATAGRTGVLIYAALHDRIAEVVADEGIYSKVPPETWGDATAALVVAARQGRLADGFVAAVGQVGQVLAAHFPPGEHNPDELPNLLVEL